MVVVNLTDSSLSILKPGGGTFNIPPKGESENTLPNVTLIKTLITMYPPNVIRLKLRGEEVNVQDHISESLYNWIYREEDFKEEEKEVELKDED